MNERSFVYWSPGDQRWTADPVGAAVLGSAIEAAAGAIPMDGNLSAMAASLPLDRIPAFVSAVTREHIIQLVTAAHAATKPEA